MDFNREFDAFVADQSHAEETAAILNKDFGPEELYTLEPEYDEDGNLLRMKRVKK